MFCNSKAVLKADKKVTFKFSKIMQFACFLLIVPIVIFIIGWFKPLWIIIALCAILILGCMTLKNICADDYRVTLSKKGLLVIFVSAFLFTYATGAGGDSRKQVICG